MEKKTLKKVYLSTPEMRYKSMLHTELGRCMKSAFGGFFTRATMAEKINYINAYASAKQSLWEEVYKTYPELTGKNLSFGEKEITVLP